MILGHYEKREFPLVSQSASSLAAASRSNLLGSHVNLRLSDEGLQWLPLVLLPAPLDLFPPRLFQ